MSSQQKQLLEKRVSPLANHALGIDHIAIAVSDLEESISWYRGFMGFEVLERRTTNGTHSGMNSAVLKAGPIMIVLLEGTSAESQVSRYIEQYGPGVQHIALQVRDLPKILEQLTGLGLNFNTTLIEGDGIRQIFTCRDPNSGMMFELIEREPNGKITDRSVQQLFDELEKKGGF